VTAAASKQPQTLLTRRERGESLARRALRTLLRDRLAVTCFVVIGVYVLVAFLGYTGALPDLQERVGEKYEPPSLELAKILGTDIFGRSILFKILAGTQTAMTIGFIVTAISLPIGISLGALAGYYGGRVDALIVWLYSVISSVPSILLIVGISYVLEKGITAICIALGAVSWVGLCRLIRGEVLKHRNREYVLAARLLGAGDARIIFRHILPNVIHLGIVTASLLILSAIKSEVILTFLGVGIQDGASWGTMITDATGELVSGIWWPLVGVTGAMFLIIYALNVAGDALRDALDPKLID
jgi:ABC-type dipeptide/oligopeptide/nickel transport system permease subunit